MTIAYRPDIDGLRAVAVLSVMIFHIFPEWLPGGFIGVDVFFVISGYLITSILLTEVVQTGSINFPAFYGRRILRIFPALGIVLLASLLAGWFVLFADEYKMLGKHVAAGASFIANFAYWSEAGYFDVRSEAKPLLHLWSLGIEEQFYIIWPFGLWLLLKAGKTARLTIWTLVLLSFTGSVVWVWLDRTAAFYNPLFRVWELLAGALIAIGGDRILPGARLLIHPLASAVGLCLIGVGSILLNKQIPFPGLAALLPVMGAMAVIASASEEGRCKRVLSSPIMVGIGKISYPLYLWHWPLLAFSFVLVGARPGVEVRAGIVVIALLLATLTYWCVERPVRKLPVRWAIGGLLVGLTILGLLGKNIFDRDGLERIRHRKMIVLSDTVNKDFLDFEKLGLITEDVCAYPFRFPERDVCLVTHKDRAATAAVVGDSHALHAFWGLSAVLDSQGINLLLQGKGACVPLLSYVPSHDINHCQPDMNKTLHRLAQDPDIHHVFLVFRGRYLSAHADVLTISSFQEDMERTLALLTHAGKRVYLFQPVAEPGFDPRLCMGNLPMGRKPPFPCVIDRSTNDAQAATLLRIEASVLRKFPQVQWIDPNVGLCEQEECPLVQEGRSIFKDDNHLSIHGSYLSARGLKLDR